MSGTTRGRLRWAIIALIALATVINYIEQYKIELPDVKVSKDIGADKADYALLVTLFMLAYAAGQSLFGRIIDVIGTRLGFVFSILIWSLSIVGHALVRSLGLISLLRVTLGVSEAGNWPGAVKANALWFPPQERAFAQGIFNAGAAIGAIIAAPAVAALYAGFGWRMTFVLVGVLGFVWLIPWLFVYRADPDRHPWLSDEERAHINARPAAVEEAAPAPGMLELLRYRQSWAILLSRFFLDPVWWLFVSWLPIYLAETFHFDVKQIGMFGWVPFVGAMLGSLGGGWFSGLLIARGWNALSARNGGLLLGVVDNLMAAYVSAQYRAAVPLLLLIAVILFGFQVAINNIQTMPGDYFAGGAVGSLAGISGTAAVAGTLITTWLVPVMTSQGYAPIFALAAAIVPLALLSILLLGRGLPRAAGTISPERNPA